MDKELADTLIKQSKQETKNFLSTTGRIIALECLVAQLFALHLIDSPEKKKLLERLRESFLAMTSADMPSVTIDIQNEIKKVCRESASGIYDSALIISEPDGK